MKKLFIVLAIFLLLDINEIFAKRSKKLTLSRKHRAKKSKAKADEPDKAEGEQNECEEISGADVEGKSDGDECVSAEDDSVKGEVKEGKCCKASDCEGSKKKEPESYTKINDNSKKEGEKEGQKNDGEEKKSAKAKKSKKLFLSRAKVSMKRFNLPGNLGKAMEKLKQIFKIKIKKLK